MRILKEFPPNYEEISQVFTLKKGVVFTYGDTIYSPDNINLSPDLIAHEMTHIAQQKDYGVERWWRRYLREPAFRASQEIPAYQAQYQFGKRNIKGRDALARFLMTLANSLSSEIYGSIMSREEALGVIKSEKLFAFKI